MVGVAQLVERRVVVADVAGSSPVTHPNRGAHSHLQSQDNAGRSSRSCE